MVFEDSLIYATQTLGVILCTTVRLARNCRCGVVARLGRTRAVFDHGSRYVCSRACTVNESRSSVLAADVLKRDECRRGRSYTSLDANACSPSNNGLRIYSDIFADF